MKTDIKVDLRSDTVTLPTQPMLAAMMQAQVGDDVFGEDPTVKNLENKMARMFGKEAGIFCPSGTMTNQIAIRLHTQQGDEVICHREAHVYKYEGGGIAVNSQASVRLLDGKFGKISEEDVNKNINNPNDIHLPITRLVCIEDSTNRGGGNYYSMENIAAISAVCKEQELAFHLDGARVFNALVETGYDYKEYGQHFDTISICLSKGLGAPVGSVLIGSKEHINKAKRIRKVLGGGMRQAGYLAAAGIYALDNHIERLKEDHARAKTIAMLLENSGFVEDIFPVKTNIVIFKLNNKYSESIFVEKLKEKNILALPFGPSLVRIVTHLGINDAMIDHLQNSLEELKI